MASKLDLMLEAERRGILPPDKQALLSEARKRGLVSDGATDSDSPPAGAQPGSAEYARWAVKQAKAGKPLPQIEGSAIPTAQQGYDQALDKVRQADFSWADPKKFAEVAKTDLGPLNPQQIAQNDQLFGFGDELAGAANATSAALQGRNPGASYSAWQQLQQARRQLGMEQGGGMAQAGSILGALTSFGGPGKMAATALPQTFGQRALQLGKDIGTGSATGAVMGGVQGFGSTDGDVGERLQGAQTGAVAGALVGAGAPVAIRAVAKPLTKIVESRAITQALKNSPNADDLSSVASQMFKTAKSSGVGVAPSRFSKLARDLTKEAVAKDIDPDLDGAALTVYQRLAQLEQQGMRAPSALSLARLHNLRQKAQDVAFETTAKPRTRQFAQSIVDGIDDMISTLKPHEITGPPNLLGNGTGAASALMDGISTWAKAKKVGLVESAMSSAENYLGGLESGLRSQFKTLLNGKNKNLWTPIERKALQEVINGNLSVKALRALGIFKGFASAGVGGALGSALGPFGSALGVGLGGAAGVAARKLTENAAAGAAGRAAKIVATPGLLQFSPTQIRVPYTTLPLVTANQQQSAQLPPLRGATIGR